MGPQHLVPNKLNYLELKIVFPSKHVWMFLLWDSLGLGPEAKLHNVPMDHVHLVGYCDFNAPNACSKTRIQDLSKALHMVNEVNGRRNVAIADYPDVPKASSKRGLADEEQDIQNAFWSFKMSCDTRFILPFDLHPAGEPLSKRRSEQFLH